MESRNPQPSDESPTNAVRHPATCDGCTKIIVGTRYKCSSCPNWDYCALCHRHASITHSMHQFSAYTEPQLIWPAIKTGLLSQKDVYRDRDMSVAEYVRRYITVTSREKFGRSQMFEYTPLAGDRSFRLLALLPGSKDDRICCKTVHATLDDMLDFEALSYAWGAHEGAGRIFVEGLEFPVTPNLFVALQRLRLAKAIRYIWVDALCIDQVDHGERATQVQHMRAIYSKARTVIFWLGEAADHSDHAMEVICGAPETADSVIAIEELFARPCWRRVWCLQELSVAQSPPVIMCGERTATWDQFEMFCANWRRSADVYPAPSETTCKQRAVQGFVTYAITRRTYQRKSPRLTLGLLLNSSQGLHATDPRDYIYGLLGLADDASQFQVDYTQDVTTVFKRATEHIINSHEDLNILFRLTNSNFGYDQPLPTWVPDWTTSLNQRPPVIQSKWLYQACGHYPADVVFDNDVVKAVGLLIDRVDQVSSPILFTEDLSNLTETIDKIDRMLRDWIYDEAGRPLDDVRVTQVLQFDPDPRSSDALWRTLICDQMFIPDSKEKQTHISGGFKKPTPDFANMYEILRYGHDCSPRLLTEDWLSFEHTTPRLRGPMSRIPEDFMPDLPIADRIERYICPLKRALMILSRRQFFITENGRMGVAEQGLQKHDLVTVLYGADMPLLLRDRKPMVSAEGELKSEPLELIGQAYVHGVMDGEAVTAFDRDEHCGHERYWFSIR